MTFHDRWPSGQLLSRTISDFATGGQLPHDRSWGSPCWPRWPRHSALVVPAGRTVALVGATGVGKSTVAKLVARFYGSAQGTVSLDGIDLRSVADADLQRAVVMVTQESFVFSASVADNIALGRVLIIAHRLSTVPIADRVLVLSDGVVVEDGTPSDLIAGVVPSRSCTPHGRTSSPDRLQPAQAASTHQTAVRGCHPILREGRRRGPAVAGCQRGAPSAVLR